MLHILGLLLVHAQAVYLRWPAVPVSVLMPHPNENCLQQRVVRSSDIKTFSDTWNYINYGGKLPHYNSILRNHFDLPISSNLGSAPHPVPVSTRTITCLVGNPYKPSLATLSSHYFQVSSLRHPTSLEIWLSCFLARNAKTSSRRALVLVPNKQNMEKPFDDSLYIFVSSTWYCSSKTPYLI